MANVEKTREYRDSSGTVILTVENGADAKNVDIDPIEGVEALTTQGALEELNDRLSDVEQGGGTPSSDAANVGYSNTNSGLSSTNVQGAIDELAASSNPSVNRIYGKTVFFFGDSLTSGVSPTGSYVPSVKTKAGLAVAQNYGSSGATSSRLVNIVTGEKIRTLESSSTTKDYSVADAVCIQIGSNVKSMGSEADIPNITVDDIRSTSGLASVYPYSYSASGKTVSSATLDEPMDFFRKCFGDTNYGNIALCVEYIRWKNPKCRIYLMTIPPNKGTNNQSPTAMFRAVHTLANLLGVEIIETYPYAGCVLDNIDDWTLDQTISGTSTHYRVHFNSTGNDMWSTYIANELKARFR